MRHALNLVTQTLGVAVKDKIITSNPGDDLEGLPEIIQLEMRCFEPAEVAQLADVFDERYRTWLRTAVGSGLRLGELSGLRAGRVDLMRRRITVVETQVEVRGHVSYSPPKTKAGRRTVPIPPSLVDLLTDQVAGLAPGDLVFTAPGGGLVRASLFRRRFWQPACVAAGFGELVEAPTEEDPKRTRYEGPRIHDLRHTAVSWWIASGANVKQLTAWAGHSSVTTVLDRYGHLLPHHEESVTEALDVMTRTPAPAAADVVRLGA